MGLEVLLIIFCCFVLKINSNMFVTMNSKNNVSKNLNLGLFLLIIYMYVLFIISSYHIIDEKGLVTFNFSMKGFQFRQSVLIHENLCSRLK